jgi:hypothetical protein
LVTTEAGDWATFTIVLKTQPTADVTIGLSSDDTSEGTVSPASVTFTPANWNTPQIVTVTGVDDNLDDGDVAYSIITAAATSGDANYDGLNAADVSVINTDNDTAGITVSPTAGLVTTEAGDWVTFTIVLNTQPTSDVTIGLTSDDTTEGTVAPASVTFTRANWNTPQIVTVTGVDDDLDDGDVAYSIVTAAATSADAGYDGLNATDVSVINTDNDTAGITVSPTAGLVTTEAGDWVTFTIVLNTQPTADVTIGLSSDDTSEGTVSPASVTFTPANWNTPQIVTVTGVDDSLDDGDVAYSIITAAATSGDVNYYGLNAADVSVTNTDNDTAGVTIVQSGGFTQVAEGGSTDTYTVVLNTQPTVDVVITVAADGQVNVNPTSLTFTAANWSTPHAVTVTAVDDAVAEGDHSGRLTHAAASGDPNYQGIAIAAVTVQITDNDTAGFVVQPVAGLMTSESGGTAVFTIALNSEPTADVTVGLASDDLTEGTVAPASVTFTPANWNLPQSVTVTGVDDFVDDADVTFTIVTAPADSGDGAYHGMNVFDVSVTNQDDDTAGVRIVESGGTTRVTEGGGSDTYTVELTSQPTADVVIGVTADSQVSVHPASLMFTAANWNTPQTVTVAAVDDAVAEAIHFNPINHAATSGDPIYQGIVIAAVTVRITDNDAAGFLVGPVFGLTTSEAGGQATFSVRLASQPTADVTIGLTSSNVSEGTVAPASLTFTVANWNVPRVVTVTGVDDLVDDGDISFTIATSAAVSDDPNYHGVDPPDVPVTNRNNDTAGIGVSAISGPTAETGITATFTIVLNSQPTDDVTIGLSSSDMTEGTVSPASVTFTAANWNAAQTVTVTGLDDLIDDGDIVFTVITAAAASGDAKYHGMNASDVMVTNVDDDTAGITVSAISGDTSEAGGAATCSIVLDSQPTADVTIGLSSSDVTEGTVSPASVTFTAANWNMPQVITVTGEDDLMDDGDIAFTIIIAAAVSGDAKYHGLNAPDVTVTNADDDTAGFTVSPTGGLTVTEAGSTASFTVVLTAQPATDVVLTVTSSDPGEAAASPGALTFTLETWNSPQTVTIIGIDDSDRDGDQITSILVAVDTDQSDSRFAAVAAQSVWVATFDDDVGWTNPRNRFDVDDSGKVDPADVLRIINYLNSHPSDPSLPAPPAAPPPYYDVNGDSFCMPNDVLMVINYLNSLSAVGGEGEAMLGDLAEPTAPSPYVPSELRAKAAVEAQQDARSNGLVPLKPASPTMSPRAAEQHREAGYVESRRFRPAVTRLAMRLQDAILSINRIRNDELADRDWTRRVDAALGAWEREFFASSDLFPNGAPNDI